MAIVPRTPQTPLARIDGWPIHLANLDAAIDRIVSRAREGCGFTVFTLNLDHLVKLRTSAAFQEAYRRADLVTADGAPVAWLSRLQGAAVTRTTGADMFIPLSLAAGRAGLPVYLFGSSPPVLAKAADTLRERSGGRVVIAGTLAPSGMFDPEGPEADAAIEAIRASGARLCFVMLGAPKQEVFSARAVAKGCPAAFICVGAAADFIAGAQRRAPALLQRYGLEWAWRLLTNPRRLARRYADCAAVLLDVAVVAPAWRHVAAREI